MSWTIERIATLKQLWAAGESASAIASSLGEVTRNGVIGKVHRLGLAGRATRSRQRRTSRAPSLFPARRRSSKTRTRRHWQSRVSAPRKRPTILPELGPPPDRPVTVQSLTGTTCRWPFGDPKMLGFHFCGRTKREGHPYCDHHAAIAYHPARRGRA